MAWLQENFAKPMAFYAEVSNMSFLSVVIILMLISLSSPATDNWDVVPCCHQGRTGIMIEEGLWAAVSFHGFDIVPPLPEVKDV